MRALYSRRWYLSLNRVWARAKWATTRTVGGCPLKIERDTEQQPIRSGLVLRYGVHKQKHEKRLRSTEYEVLRTKVLFVEPSPRFSISTRKLFCSISLLSASLLPSFFSSYGPLPFPGSLVKDSPKICRRSNRTPVAQQPWVSHRRLFWSSESPGVGKETGDSEKRENLVSRGLRSTSTLNLDPPMLVLPYAGSGPLHSRDYNFSLFLVSLSVSTQRLAARH